MGCNNRKVNTTNLARIDGGDLIKQGDLSSTFGFELLDENYRVMTSFEGQRDNAGGRQLLPSLAILSILI